MTLRIYVCEFFLSNGTSEWYVVELKLHLMHQPTRKYMLTTPNNNSELF